MRFSIRQIEAAIAVVVAGTAVGMMLAAFTMGGMWPSSPVSTGAGPYRAEAPAPVVPAAPPERYVCKGCFPTLAERQAQYYAGVDMGGVRYDETAQLEPLPPYQPVPFVDEKNENVEAQPQADNPPSEPAGPTAEVAYW